MIRSIAKRGLIMGFLLAGVAFFSSPQLHSAAKMTEDERPTGASAASAKQGEIVSALTGDDWKALGKVLSDLKIKGTAEKICEMEPSLRFLTGHAALATGANMEAVSCFYCPCDSNGSASLQTWDAWTRKLIEDNKGSVSASMHYLRGDALARNRNLKGAINEFDAVLVIDPANVMALNARGVVKWLLFEQDSTLAAYELGSVQDLMAASEAAPNFADAWANRGLIGLRDYGSLDRAQQMFDRAVEVDSAYWLARNGRAVSAGAAGRYWEFKKEISFLMDKAPTTPYVQINAAVSGDKRVSPGARGAMQAISTVGNWAERSGMDPVAAGGVILGDMARWKLDLLNRPEIRQLEQTNTFMRIANTLERGGIFMFVRDGENLNVAEDGKPRLSGTWFALNYPLTLDGPSKQK